MITPSPGTQQASWLPIIAGAVVLVALARFQPKIAGWVVLALVIGLFAIAAEKGVFG